MLWLGAAGGEVEDVGGVCLGVVGEGVEVVVGGAGLECEGVDGAVMGVGGANAVQYGVDSVDEVECGDAVGAGACGAVGDDVQDYLHCGLADSVGVVQPLDGCELDECGGGVERPLLLGELELVVVEVDVGYLGDFLEGGADEAVKLFSHKIKMNGEFFLQIISRGKRRKRQLNHKGGKVD